MTGEKRRSARALAVLALFLGSPACAAGGPGQDDPKVLTDLQDGVTRAVARGSTVEVRLPAQLGTGFSWTLTAPEGVEQVGEPVTRGGGTPGAGETQVFTLRATAIGRHVVTFTYGQPFAGGEKATKTVRYTFDVT